MKSASQAQLPFDASQPTTPRSATGHACNAAPANPPAEPEAAPQIDLVGRRTPSGQLPLLLTIRDVEAELQLGRTRTYELIRSGQLPVIRLGRAVRVPREALRRWIDDHCAPSNQGATNP
jgi:excisionase family DNA binding protein